MKYVITFFASVLFLSCSTKSNPTSTIDNTLVLPAVFKGITSFYAGDTLNSDYSTKSTTLTLDRADSTFHAYVEDTSITHGINVIHFTMSGSSTDPVNNLTYNVTRLSTNGVAVFDAAKINLTITTAAPGITTKFGTPCNLIMKVKR